MGDTEVSLGSRFRTVTAELPTAEGAATLLACTLTVLGEGIVGGAEYNPPAETVPTVVFPPAIPLTSQVKPRLEVPDIEADSWTLPPTGRFVVAGATVTTTSANSKSGLVQRRQASVRTKRFIGFRSQRRSEVKIERPITVCGIQN
jgi:hypothetical protein